MVYVGVFNQKACAAQEQWYYSPDMGADRG